MVSLMPKRSSQKRFYGEGIVSEMVYPGKEWRVEFKASYWTARSYYSTTFKPGDFVRVVEIDLEDLTLLIEPIGERP